jgi:hypothetical protein
VARVAPNAEAEADLHIRLRQSDIHMLRAIDAALKRIIQDRFGVCEACGSPISPGSATLDASAPRKHGAGAVSSLTNEWKCCAFVP